MSSQRFVEQLFKIITPKEQAELPSVVIEWVQAQKKNRGIHEYSWSGHHYILISLGFRPNPGYRIEVVKVEKSNQEIVVIIKELQPEPGKMYPQVIVYPYILAEVRGTVQVKILTPDGEVVPFG